MFVCVHVTGYTCSHIGVAWSSSFYFLHLKFIYEKIEKKHKRKEMISRLAAQHGAASTKSQSFTIVGTAPQDQASVWPNIWRSSLFGGAVISIGTKIILIWWDFETISPKLLRTTSTAGGTSSSSSSPRTKAAAGHASSTFTPLGHGLR